MDRGRSAAWWPGPSTTGVPVLGVCFGGQLLAQVLGGSVARAARPEIGWRLLDDRRPGRGRRPGPGSTGTRTPSPARREPSPLATTEVSLHAFVQGPHTGVQFHPEVTLAVVEGWIGDARERAGLTDDDVDALRAGFDARGRGPDALSRALFEGWLERAGARI